MLVLPFTWSSGIKKKEQVVLQEQQKKTLFWVGKQGTEPHGGNMGRGMCSAVKRKMGGRQDALCFHRASRMVEVGSVLVCVSVVERELV